MLTAQDIHEERLIDRLGYECECCHWRSHTDVNRNRVLDMLLCDDCSRKLSTDGEDDQDDL